MHIWTSMLSVGLILGASTAGAETPDLHLAVIEGAQQILIPHKVGRSSPGLVSTRVSKDKAFLVTSATYQWPGTYFDAAFKGDTVFVRLNDSANILNVLIDGKRVATLNKPGEVVETYKGLGDGQHVITVERLTETQGATGTFEGFYSVNGPLLTVKPSTRQIEFIGDSYTAGYGDTSLKRECTKDEIWATTDTQQAWGPLAAKHYKADYQVNAYSGIGFVRNYDGSPGDTLPERYPYALFDTKVEYKDETWKPQIIVIALGGNDFSTPVRANEKWASEEALTNDFEATYLRFLKDLRAKNPSAGFLLLSYDSGRISATIQRVMSALQATGESHIGFLEVSGFTQTGCDWHLDLNDHIKVASLVETYIDTHPSLWPQTWSAPQQNK